jgi:CheY-like chemotaxis protein
MAYLPHILVIDDDADGRFLLSNHIRQLGYKVSEASTGQQALDILTGPNADQIDLVLTDLWMPEMSGLQMLSALRRTHPDLPVAVITANASLETSLEAYSYNVYDYILKPFNRPQIETTVEKGLKKAEEARTLRWLNQQKAREAKAEEIMRKLTHFDTQKTMSSLFDELRHELGNSTMAIQLNLETIRNYHRLPADLQVNLSDLEASTNELSALIERFGVYPTPEQIEQPIDLYEVLENALEIARYRAQRVMFHYKPSIREVPAQGAAAPLGRVFLHLLEYAAQTSNHVQVTLGMAAEAAEPTVVLELNGSQLGKTDSSGRHEEAFAHLTGLTLLIAKMVITLHRGQFFCQRLENGGILIRVMLPFAQVQPLLKILA